MFCKYGRSTGTKCEIYAYISISKLDIYMQRAPYLYGKEITPVAGGWLASFGGFDILLIGMYQSPVLV